MKTLKLSKSLVGIIVASCLLLMVFLHLHVTDRDPTHSVQQNKLRFSSTVPTPAHNIDNLHRNDDAIDRREFFDAENESSHTGDEQTQEEPHSENSRITIEKLTVNDSATQQNEDNLVKYDMLDGKYEISPRNIPTAVEEATANISTPSISASDASPGVGFGFASITTLFPINQTRSENFADFHQTPDESALIIKSHDIEILANSSVPAREILKTGTIEVEDSVYSNLIQLYEKSLLISDVLGLVSDEDIVRVTNTGDVDVVYSFHNALKKGMYCVTKKSKFSSAESSRSYSFSRSNSASDDPMITTLKAAVKSQALEFVVEYISKGSVSTKSFTKKISKYLPHFPVISMIYNQNTGYDVSSSSQSSNDESCGELVKDYDSPQRNIFRSIDPAVPFLTDDGRNCLQVLESFSFFVNDLLPFEFEQLLRDVLCQCRYTILPSRLPDLPYFANWDNVQSLIDASSTGQNRRCDVSIHDGSGDFQSIKYDSVIVSQNITFLNASSETMNIQSFGARSGKLLVIDFEKVTLDNPSRLNLAREVATFFDMVDIGNMTSFFHDISSFKDLAWNGSVLINMSAPSDISWSSSKKYQRFDQSSIPTSRSKSGLKDLNANIQNTSNLTSPSPIQTGNESQSVSELHSIGLEKQSNISEFGLSPALVGIDNDINSINATRTSLVLELANSTVDLSPQFQVRRRLYSYSDSNAVANSDSKDVLGSNRLNFAWILPKDDQLDVRKVEDASVDLENTLIATYKDAMRFISTDPSQKGILKVKNKDSSRFYITKDSRKLHSMLYREENFGYHQWMHHFHSSRLSTIKKPSSILEELMMPSTKLVYVYGQRMSLVSVKLAKMYASRRKSGVSGSDPMVVTMASDRKSAMTQYRLTKLMNIGNNVITVPQWSIGTIVALLGSTERSDIAIFETDILWKVVAMSYEFMVRQSDVDGSGFFKCKTDLITQLFSILIATGKVSYIKFSVPHITEAIMQIIAPQCSDDWSSLFSDPLNFLTKVATEMRFHVNYTVEEIHSLCSWKSDCFHGSRTSPYDIIEDNMMLYRFSFKKIMFEQVSTDSKDIYEKFWQKSSKYGLSIYSAVWMGILAEQKKNLLELLVNLPLWKAQGSSFEEALGSLSPWNVFLQVSSGKDSSAMSNTSPDSSKEEPQVWKVMIHGLDKLLSSSSTMTVANSIFPLGITSASKSLDITNEVAIGKSLWGLLQIEFSQHAAELANGKFSFVEHDSGNGFISSRLSMEFPEATVISIERDEYYTSLHNRVVEMLNISNNAVCLKNGMDDETIYRNIYECPELFRFQLLFRNVLQGFKDSASLDSWGNTMGMALSTALTSFVYVPNRSLVSWALYILFGPIYLYGSQGSFDGSIGNNEIHIIRSPGSYRSLYDAVGCIESDSSDHKGSTFTSSTAQSAREDSFLHHYRELSVLNSHPQKPFNNFPSDWLLSTARAKDGSTSLLISPLSTNGYSERVEGDSSSNMDMLAIRYRGQIINIHKAFLEFPLVRCDIVNMTRHVHHHFDYKKDGHSRTYTMHVDVNQTLTTEVENLLGHDISKSLSVVDQTGVHLRSKDNYYRVVTLPLGYHPSQHNAVSVKLYRDKDTWPIPYVSIYGITLISALRLGLNNEQRDRFFHSFLQLPLYEDMAPWNIVLMGPKLDYIDYDTKDFSFNSDIPKAYKVMSVLMNYKRTVEDFKKCGSKASTVYGLPFVSDCVGNSDLNLKCDDLGYPVPCSDGKCHSDYISCLRSLADIAQKLADYQLKQRRESFNNEPYFEHLSQNLASAMNAVVAKFNETSYAKLTYEEFLEHQLK